MSEQTREVAPPDITVVIATRDRPELMREALEAVGARQHDAIVRTILVFDQSESDLTLVDDDALRPVDVVRNHRKAGLAGAHNTGIELATTPLVALRDVWLPGRLAPVRALAAAPHSVLATTGIRVEQGGRVHDRVLEQTEVALLDLLADRHTELHPSTFLLRTGVLVRLGLVEEDVPGGFGEDHGLLLRCAREAPVLHVSEPLVRIRWAPSPTSRDAGRP